MSPKPLGSPPRRGTSRPPAVPFSPLRVAPKPAASPYGYDWLGRYLTPGVPATHTSKQLAHPEYYIVKLRDGRPGIVAAADHTRVWVPARSSNVPLPQYEFHSPLWWNRLLEAMRPTAGFVFYSDDADTKSMEDPNRYVRKGYVYEGMDITWLKRAMDMSMDGWAKPDLKTHQKEKLLNWLLRLSKNSVATYGKVKDTAGAVEAISEELHADPEVKVVVYSGYKTSLAQVDSMRNVPAPRRATTGGAGYERVPRGATQYDSLWVEKHYQGKKLIGRLVAPPKR